MKDVMTKTHYIAKLQTNVTYHHLINAFKLVMSCQNYCTTSTKVLVWTKKCNIDKFPLNVNN